MIRSSLHAVVAVAAVALGLAGLVGLGPALAGEGEAPLGLPPVPYPADNPQSAAKVELGKTLFEDTRFSSTGTVSCSTCHSPDTGFTDSPKQVSLGIDNQPGTRNAPTVINSAYFETMFWDGRSPDLEDQALHPFVNPIEMGLKDHEPILEIVRTDRAYKKAFKKVFGAKPADITMSHVTRAIAAFERTVVAGNSPFDRWFYGGEEDALTEQQKRGYELFVMEARCVSCHVIEQTQALFTDNRFHNVGVGVNRIQDDIPTLVAEYTEAEKTLSEVDEEVLSDPRSSELGRFAVNTEFDDIGAFKTPTLRNVAATAPYMHDGSLKTLVEVMEHYNNGGVTQADEPVNDFLAGGIRPLNLTDEQINDVVAFMEALTSPEFQDQVSAQPQK
jgi:cytochrome c peroxidase